MAEDGKPKCEGGCKRIWNIMRSILFAFRNRFPARFQKGSSEDLLFLVSTAESPALTQECYERPGSCGRRRRGDFAPILHFGSSFGDETELQSLVVMPPPPRVHLRCMAEWQMYHNVCPFLMPKTVKEDGSETPGLVFGEHINYNEDAERKKKTKEGEVEELFWGDLIPQVVWRGADLPYLPQQHPTMRSPDFKADVEAKFDQSGHGLLHMLRSLRDIYNDLRPRWKAIVLTAEAEFDANNANANPKRKQKVVPWANMKFSSRADPDLDSQSRWSHQDKADYAEWTQVGIPAWGGPYTVEQMAKFKYHLDLGGGQGTSWGGTMQKLALPGVLFHHNTGTVDWFHEHLVPWIHYIPVEEDLSDLHEKFLWAESHQHKVQEIARHSTEFVRRMGRPEGMDELYRKHLLKPLEDVIANFDPTNKMPSDFLAENDLVFEEVMRCTGHDVSQCHLLR